MKKRIQLASFDFYDSTGIEHHLTKMASKGGAYAISQGGGHIKNRTAEAKICRDLFF